MYIAIFFSLLVNQTTYLKETEHSYIFHNRIVKVEMSKQTYNISSIIVRGCEILTRECTTVIQSAGTEYISRAIRTEITEYTQQESTVSIEREYADKTVNIRYLMDSLAFRYEITLLGKNSATHEVNVQWVLPVSRCIDSLFAPSSNYPSKFALSDRSEFIYRKSIFIPLLTLYNSTYDLGISLIIPLEIHKPFLSFKVENGNVSVSFKHGQLHSGKETKFGISFVPHNADWRPAFRYSLDRYSEYFSPATKSVDFANGWYFQGQLYHDENAINEATTRGAGWVEFHYYFPFFYVFLFTYLILYFKPLQSIDISTCVKVSLIVSFYI